MFRTLGIVGATGAVGRIIRRLLEERRFPVEHVRLIASDRSAGQTLRFRNREIEVERLRPELFEEIDLCISSTPDEVAREFIPWAVERGTVVVDESGAWRMDPDVPLVIPEVNAEALGRHRGLIASPNCSTAQLVMAIKPIHDAARVCRVVVSTYQAASGAGVAGERDWELGTRALLDGLEYTCQVFPHSIASNLIPEIGRLQHQGYTSEEMKMVRETHKILEDDSIQICPTCVRVPVANCHSESILLETERKVTADEARDLFRAFEGIEVIDDVESHSYPMPAWCIGRDEVFVGRIREDLSHASGLAFWCVSDNLRKGAATNAVQIAEHLGALTEPSPPSSGERAG